MYKEQRILGLIIAREGSKGLPGKNIKDLNGKPLIQYTVEASADSKYLDRTIISTDGKEIIKVVKKMGGDAPFVRPSTLSEDLSSVDDVVEHAVSFLKSEKEDYDLLLLLQATSPLRTSVDIDKAIVQFIDQENFKSKTLVSVTKAPSKMAYLMNLNDSSELEFCFKDNKGTQRQEANTFYIPNGAIYILNINKREEGFFAGSVVPFEMDSKRSVDIDTIEDFELAEKNLNGL